MKVKLIANIRVYDAKQQKLVSAIRTLRSFTNIPLRDATEIIDKAIKEVLDNMPAHDDAYPAQYVAIPLILSLEQFGYMNLLQCTGSEDYFDMWYDAVEKYDPPVTIDASNNTLNLF